MNGKDNPKQLLHSIVRSFRIAELLAEKGELGVSEIDAYLGIDKSSAYRILATLKDMGYVRQNPANRKYSNTLKFSRLGGADPDIRNIRERTHPMLQEMADSVGEAANLGFLEGAEIVYVETIQCSQTIQVNLPVGQKMPAYCSALGKAILAFMPEEKVRELFPSGAFGSFTEHTLKSPDDLMRELEIIRSEGFARDVQESHPGLSCLAAPIFQSEGRVVAGVSVSFPTFRRPEMSEAERLIVPVLLETAARISEDLGYTNGKPMRDRAGTTSVRARKRLEE